MKLISEILKKRLGLSQEFQLTHYYLQSIWHFYSVYNICLSITGKEDKEINKKNILMSKLIKSSPRKFDFKIYGKIINFMKKDMEVINLAFEKIELIEEESDFLGDYDIPDCIAVGIYD